MKKRPRYGILINGDLLMVKEMKDGLENGFQRGFAYRMRSIIYGGEEIVLPVVESFQFHSELKKVNPRKSLPGIYVFQKKLDSEQDFRVVMPHRSVVEKYKGSNIIDLIDTVVNGNSNNFIKKEDIIVGTGDAFVPPFFNDDDGLNSMVKAAIALKQVPFNAYALKLEQSGVGGKKDSNTVGNTKKALMNNHAMSATKASYYSDAFELLPAYLITDAPGSQNPAFHDGEILIVFPNGEFDIDPSKFIRVEDVLSGEYNGIAYGSLSKDKKHKK